MQSCQAVMEHLLSHPRVAERRSQPRISAPFAATVQGIDARGEAFRSATVVDNISAGGLYLRLVACPELRAKLSLVVQVASAPTGGEEALRLRIDGEVLRIEPLPGGACGLAVLINRRRFV